jgi:hypothetical protein
MTAEGDRTVWRMPEGLLQITGLTGTADAIATLHQEVIDAVRADASPFEVRRDDVRISSAYRADDTWVYLRSHDLPDDRKGATLIEWNADSAAEARLIVASLQRADLTPLELPEAGLLHAALQAAGWQGAEPLPAGKTVATGLRIGPTDLVTPGAVLASCGVLRLPDGTELRPLSVEPATRLAILTAPEPAADPGGLPIAAGWPEGTARATIVTPAGPVEGSITAPGTAATDRILSPDRFFAAPGDAADPIPGSPVLNAAGQIVGIVLPRASGQPVDPERVPLVSAQRLARQLRHAGLAADAMAPEPDAGADSASDALHEAIVPLTCG